MGLKSSTKFLLLAAWPERWKVASLAVVLVHALALRFGRARKRGRSRGYTVPANDVLSADSCSVQTNSLSKASSTLALISKSQKPR